MRAVFILPFLTLFGQCKSQDQQHCKIISSILDYKVIQDILSFEYEDNGPIRIIDKTDLFIHCQESFAVHRNSPLFPLGVKILKDTPIDLNTGYYRDIVIQQYTLGENSLRLEIYLSPYVCKSDKKDRVHISLEYSLNVDEKPQLLDHSIGTWH